MPKDIVTSVIRGDLPAVKKYVDQGGVILNHDEAWMSNERGLGLYSLLDVAIENRQLDIALFLYPRDERKGIARDTILDWVIHDGWPEFIRAMARQMAPQDGPKLEAMIIRFYQFNLVEACQWIIDARQDCSILRDIIRDRTNRIERYLTSSASNSGLTAMQSIAFSALFLLKFALYNDASDSALLIHQSCTWKDQEKKEIITIAIKSDNLAIFSAVNATVELNDSILSSMLLLADKNNSDLIIDHLLQTHGRRTTVFIQAAFDTQARLELLPRVCSFLGKRKIKLCAKDSQMIQMNIKYYLEGVQEYLKECASGEQRLMNTASHLSGISYIVDVLLPCLNYNFIDIKKIPQPLLKNLESYLKKLIKSVQGKCHSFFYLKCHLSSADTTTGQLSILPHEMMENVDKYMERVYASDDKLLDKKLYIHIYNQCMKLTKALASLNSSQSNHIAKRSCT